MFFPLDDVDVAGVCTLAVTLQLPSLMKRARARVRQPIFCSRLFATSEPVAGKRRSTNVGWMRVPPTLAVFLVVSDAQKPTSGPVHSGQVFAVSLCHCLCRQRVVRVPLIAGSERYLSVWPNEQNEHRTSHSVSSTGACPSFPPLSFCSRRAIVFRCAYAAECTKVERLL